MELAVSLSNSLHFGAANILLNNGVIFQPRYCHTSNRTGVVIYNTIQEICKRFLFCRITLFCGKYWNRNVDILMKLLSSATQEAVILKTSSATGNRNSVKIIFLLRWISTFPLRWVPTKNWSLGFSWKLGRIRRCVSNFTATKLVGSTQLNFVARMPYLS